MRKIFTLLAIAASVAGCASTLPTCDGKNRRPINAPDRAEVFHPSCGMAA
ncbi:hypothetical protein [Massilia sp. Leaf139]|nr:hypothetical protein [Massilia sp. Leaf139]